MKKLTVNWEKINWCKGTSELAKELNVGKSTITRYRKQHAPETRQDQVPHDFTSLNWLLSTTELAQALDVQPSIISRARRKYAPETIRLQRFNKITGAKRPC